MKANRIWFKINNHYLYEEFIFIEDENKVPKVVSLKDDLGNYYIGFVNATLDWDEWKHNESILQRVSIDELINYLQSDIGLQNLLKSKETAFRIRQKSNVDEDIVEVVDSTYVDTYGWHDPAKLGELCREQKEYLDKLKEIKSRGMAQV